MSVFGIRFRFWRSRAGPTSRRRLKVEGKHHDLRLAVSPPGPGGRCGSPISGLQPAEATPLQWQWRKRLLTSVIIAGTGHRNLLQSASLGPRLATRMPGWEGDGPPGKAWPLREHRSLRHSPWGPRPTREIACDRAVNGMDVASGGLMSESLKMVLVTHRRLLASYGASAPVVPDQAMGLAHRVGSTRQFQRL
jgi:hypothetical protein